MENKKNISKNSDSDQFSNIDNIKNGIYSDDNFSQPIFDEQTTIKETMSDDNLDLSILDNSSYVNEKLDYNKNITVEGIFSKKDYKQIFSQMLANTVQSEATERSPSPIVIGDDAQTEQLINATLSPTADDEYRDLKNQLSIEGIKLKPYMADLKYLKLGLLLKNKLIMACSIVLTLLFFVDLTVFYFVFDNDAKLGLATYIVMGAVALIPLVSGITVYIKNKNFKTKDRFKFNKCFIFSLIILSWLIVLDTLFAILFNANMANIQHLTRFILLPSFFVLNVPLMVLFYAFLKNFKMFYC